MTKPMHESNLYEFHIMRVGACIVRKRDNASVYFPPGDVEEHAIENAAHCFAHGNMYPGECVNVYNKWADQYFSRT